MNIFSSASVYMLAAGQENTHDNRPKVATTVYPAPIRGKPRIKQASRIDESSVSRVGSESESETRGGRKLRSKRERSESNCGSAFTSAGESASSDSDCSHDHRGGVKLSRRSSVQGRQRRGSRDGENSPDSRESKARADRDSMDGPANDSACDDSYVGNRSQRSHDMDKELPVRQTDAMRWLHRFDRLSRAADAEEVNSFSALSETVAAAYAAHRGEGTAVPGFESHAPVALLALLRRDAPRTAEVLLNVPARQVRYLFRQVPDASLLEVLDALLHRSGKPGEPFCHLLTAERRLQMRNKAQGDLKAKFREVEKKLKAYSDKDKQRPARNTVAYSQWLSGIVQRPCNNYLTRDFMPSDSTIGGVLSRLAKENLSPVLSKSARREMQETLVDVWKLLCEKHQDKLVEILCAVPSSDVVDTLLASVPYKVIEKAISRAQTLVPWGKDVSPQDIGRFFFWIKRAASLACFWRQRSNIRPPNWVARKYTERSL